MQQKPAPMTKSELTQHLKELSQREAYFRKIAEYAPVMLWMSDIEGKSLFCNKKWQKFTGFNAVVDPGSVWLDALHPDEREACLAAFKKAFAAQLPFKMEYRLRRHDGEYRWLLDIGEPYYDHQGDFIGFIGSSQDITERKQAEKGLQRSFDELNRRERESALLTEMNGCLQVCRSMEETHPVIKLFAKQLFSGYAGLIGTINDSRSLVETIVEWGGGTDSETLFPPEDCWSLRQGKPHTVADPKEGLLCAHVGKNIENGYLCLSMTAYGETRGILHLQLLGNASNDHRKDGIRTVVNLAVTFADQVALALANLKLREALQHQSVRDPLTQLYNRRYLLETLERELARAKRNKLRVGVVMIDVDHFKQYNDIHGHDAGDALLREFGAFLKHQARKEDIPCRYGGEEFVLVMPGFELDRLLQRCDDIRKKTKQLIVKHRDHKLETVTISMGVSIFPDHGETPEVLITAADAAMYQAKHKGRDRVVPAVTDGNAAS